MPDKKGVTVESTIGELPIDTRGSAISVVRMDPAQSYPNIPELLKSFINEGNIASWEKIETKIDYTCANLNYLLRTLNDAAGFGNMNGIRLPNIGDGRT
jgi:hypothetical protein